ncbi:MAG TPA: hypothetical protein VIG66_11330 [Noviherbaspirillum sp.]
MSLKTLLEHVGLGRPRAPRPAIRFASVVGNFSVSPVTAVKEAKSLDMRPQWIKTQLQSGHTPVASCPGIWDFVQAGFLIPAHCDIRIRATPEEVLVEPLGLANMMKMDEAEVQKLSPVKFDYNMVTGNAPIQEGVVHSVEKLPLPWGIFLEEGWSAYVVPALMHSAFLDKIHVYPGLADYDRFSTCNFIFSVLKECDFTIYAGEPLLHVIPFRREEITASCGRATQEELDRHHFSVVSRKRGFFRRFVHQKKVFRMGCPFHAAGHKTQA